MKNQSLKEKLACSLVTFVIAAVITADDFKRFVVKKSDAEISDQKRKKDLYRMSRPGSKCGPWSAGS